MSVIKLFFIITFALALFGCASSKKLNSYVQIPVSHMVTLPNNDNIVIIDVSARQSFELDKLALAKGNAASKAAMYYGFSVTFIETQKSVGGYLSYSPYTLFSC